MCRGFRKKIERLVDLIYTRIIRLFVLDYPHMKADRQLSRDSNTELKDNLIAKYSHLVITAVG